MMMMPVKGYCVDMINKIMITWLLVDMKFLFSCSTRRKIPYLRAPMYYSLCSIFAIYQELSL